MLMSSFISFIKDLYEKCIRNDKTNDICTCKSNCPDSSFCCNSSVLREDPDILNNNPNCDF